MKRCRVRKVTVDITAVEAQRCAGGIGAYEDLVWKYRKQFGMRGMSGTVIIKIAGKKVSEG